MPAISIIIPMYNVEKYLHRCLDSVRNQTFQDWQAICVDDGSPDKSGEIAEEYATKDKRFVVVHKENGGLSSARNVGLDKATGEYIMFLDSDDCIHPQTMDIVYNIAQKTKGDIISFEYDREAHSDKNAINFPADKMPETFKYFYNINKVKYKYYENLMARSTNHDYGIKAWYIQTAMVWMRIFRRDFIGSLRFNESIKLLEDYIFWSMILLKKPCGVITRLPLYFYTVNPTSLLHSGVGIDRILGQLYGIQCVANEYKIIHNQRNSKIWYRRFLWSILPRILRGAQKMPDGKDKKAIVSAFNDLKNDGILDLAPGFHARRYRRRILDFISQNS